MLFKLKKKCLTHLQNMLPYNYKANQVNYMLTEEQKQKRKNGIGGSDVAAICGLNPYKSAIDVYFDKILDKDEDIKNDNIWWGNELESVIVKKYLDTFPQKITFPDTKIDAEYPFLLANVDGLLEDGAILEAKNVGIHASKKWGQQFTDDIPIPYYLQIAHYARIFKAPYAHIAAYFGGSDFRIYEYIPNRKIEEMIVDKCTNFWENHVLKRIPPPISDYKDQVKVWHTAMKDSAKEVSSDIMLTIKQLNEHQQNIKQLEKKSEELKSSICSYLEDKERLIDEYGKTLVTWKNQNSSRFDLTTFKTSQEDLYKKFIIEKQSRVLRLCNIGEAA
jgi:putative phage-type endonuclease